MDDQTALCAHQLTAQINLLEALTQLLDDELEALASRNGDNLKEIARTKLTTLNQLQKLDKDLSKYPQNTFSHDEITPLTEQVKDLLYRCKKQNDVNAQAAHQAQLTVRELKDILIGAPTSMTYGQDGSVVSNMGELVKNIKA
ncbi:flagellar protein FlgN [Pseudoalteromonas sp. OOF1S-7]|uniref:flagellar export chaperone FlgN n=1 Tax=Pseudoalteromonas sp. OOF1S-7 TaxID=2917757 RepID=UPI001EF4DD95|nr:flagellar protein FlgN [Pseudoalteromonas sp. OOF1S-7]